MKFTHDLLHWWSSLLGNVIGPGQFFKPRISPSAVTIECVLGASVASAENSTNMFFGQRPTGGSIYMLAPVFWGQAAHNKMLHSTLTIPVIRPGPSRCNHNIGWKK